MSKKPTMRELQQFTNAVKQVLDARLEGLSLKLLDVGLQTGKSDIELPGATVLKVRGWVQRPITQEVKEFSIRFGADIGAETQPEDVDELCVAILESCERAFWPTVASA